ncbi:response regulator transcription factor [Ramlibacter sp.]|uniref:response regulator transcription factor n=1 Tax=Ramlibacter sp. TaxID=1917967 RepID=UPI002D6514F0|nr:response regulator [Ramlibacter sp.]HYD75988.1 response regulator [Ramlibacter sp.]
MPHDPPTVQQVRAGGQDGRPQVHVIDDDPGLRRVLSQLLTKKGHSVVAHPDADSFTALAPPLPHGCILLDVALPGADGISLYRRIAGDPDTLPVVFLSGCADVATCASAMRAGAIDFLPKPVDARQLLAAVTRALAVDQARRMRLAMRQSVEHRMALLTTREREVLVHVMDGRLNKQIAADLQIAEKTIKVHRARGLHKMGVRSAVELVRVVDRAFLA